MSVTRLPVPVLLLMALLGCTGGPSANLIRVQLSSEPVTLDPALTEDGNSMRVLHNTMEGLLRHDGAGRLVPALAERYDIEQGGKRYRFHLRSNAGWSDGMPVEAEHVALGIRRSRDPFTGSKMAPLLSAIHEVRVEAGAVVIDLHRPAPWLLEALTLTVAMPAREDVLAANKGKWDERAPSTGPYRVSARKTDQYIRLEPNPHHWAYADAERKPLPIEMKIVRDESTAMSLFESGQLDILTKIPGFDLKRLTEKKVVRTDPFMATYYLSFNARKKPFDDPVFRRAVAGAIRKQELVQALGSGETAASSWVPKGLEGSRAFRTEIPVFEGALRAMKGKGGAGIEAGFDSSGRNATVMEKVQQDLASRLDLRIALRNMDWKSYVSLLKTDAPPIFRFARLAPFMDPISHLQAFTSKDPNNFSRWGSARYDRLVEEIAALPSGPGRQKKIEEADRLLTEEEAIVVPLYHYVQTHAVAPRVRGFRANPFGVILFSELEL